MPWFFVTGGSEDVAIEAANEQEARDAAARRDHRFDSAYEHDTFYNDDFYKLTAQEIHPIPLGDGWVEIKTVYEREWCGASGTHGEQTFNASQSGNACDPYEVRQACAKKIRKAGLVPVIRDWRAKGTWREV
jgi:hypothetical protein